jgi:iron complex transport system permease protein
MRSGVPPSTASYRSAQTLRLIGHCSLGAILIAATCAVSLVVGPRYIPVESVLRIFYAGDITTFDDIILHDSRIPRTLLGLICGAALGVAGALMQAATRNPLADPGLLGVNAGAAFFMTLAAGVLGWHSIDAYIWAAFAGSVVVSIVVYGLAGAGEAGRSSGASPVRLVIAGVAMSAVLAGISSSITLIDPQAFDAMRTWAVGSLGGRDMHVVATVSPFIAVGLVIAAIVSLSLNVIALGEDLARSVGANIKVTYALAVISVTLLTGAATAAIGPVGFVGLMVPHTVRWLVGPDQRKIIAVTMVVSPILLLAADIAGRLLLYPGELEAGIITAFVGAPVLILLSRRKAASGL